MPMRPLRWLLPTFRISRRNVKRDPTRILIDMLFWNSG
jgi:hypothetical protein